MRAITRRQTIAGLAALAAPWPFVTWRQSFAAYPSMLIRHDVRSSQGASMLELYAQAVDTMKAMADEGDPRSWVFQWYTHRVRGDQSKPAELNRIYPDPADPRRALADDMWSTCQAHGANDDEDMFLPWHRMFVYFFEQIVRSVLAEPSFTLPYWNYTAIDGQSIPELFRESGGPLFQPNRNFGVNQGNPIAPPGILNLNAMLETAYTRIGAAPGFNEALDFGLHGTVHVRIGNATNMGSVPWAARDAIFWMHHCNIDRLWASWNAADRTNPAVEQSSQTFVFADADGNRVEAMVSEFNAIEPLGYAYDAMEPVPAVTPPATVVAARAPAAGVTPPAAQAPMLLAAPTRTEPIELGAEPVRVALAPAADEPAAAPSLAEGMRALARSGRVYLVLEDVHAAEQPGIIYSVHLNLPPDAEPMPEDETFVGALNFFNAVPHEDHGRPSIDVSFDVTALVRDLQERGRLGEQPEVTLAPLGAPAEGSQPVVGSVRLVLQP